jgi:hypothetical protein
MISRTVAVVIAASVMSLPAAADDASPNKDVGRYTFKSVDNGVVRLDSQTGEVALCSQRTVGWACVAAPEDRAAFENEIARLRSENAALKNDILSAGLPLPSGVAPEPPVAGNNELILRLPSGADVDRAMAYMGRIWNQLFETLARAEKQILNKS